MFLDPQAAASAALAASKVQPEGAGAVVSGEESQGLFSSLAKIASGFVHRTAEATAEVLKPASLAVPGGSGAVAAAAKLADASTGIAKSTSKAIDNAGAGIKTGFTVGIAAVVIIIFLFLRHNLK